MKKTILITLTVTLFYNVVSAQTNTFPSSGNVGVGTTSPNSVLQLNVAEDSKPGNISSPTQSIFKMGRSGTSNYSYPEAAEFRIGHGGSSVWGSKLDLYINGASNQTAIPDRHTMTWLYNGNVGIGTNNPQYKMQLEAGHGDSNFNLHFNNGDLINDAHLTLWASEPGLTYTGTGIGNNVFNSSDGAGVIRINNLRGGSYMRLLDQEIRLNVVKQDGIHVIGLSVNSNGLVGVGTTTPKEKLSVNGKIRAHEIKVEMANWPDYVFEQDYKILGLQDLDAYIKAHKHLPEMPTAKEVEANGVALGETNKLLLKKVEELTLYIIEKDKKITAQEFLLKAEEKRNNLQEERLKKLENSLFNLKK